MLSCPLQGHKSPPLGEDTRLHVERTFVARRLLYGSISRGGVLLEEDVSERNGQENMDLPVLKSSTNFENSFFSWSFEMASGFILRSSRSHVRNSWAFV